MAVGHHRMLSQVQMKSHPGRRDAMMMIHLDLVDTSHKIIVDHRGMVMDHKGVTAEQEGMMDKIQKRQPVIVLPIVMGMRKGNQYILLLCCICMFVPT